MHEVRGEPRHRDYEAQHHQVARLRARGRAGDVDAEQTAGRDLDRPRGVVVVEPGYPDEAPRKEELRRQCRNCKIETLDAQRRQAEHRADGRGEETRQRDMHDDVDVGKDRRELVTAVCADPHEARGAERDQAGIAGQDIERDRREREHQNRDQHRRQHERRSEQRRHHEGEEQDHRDADAILAQRKHRGIRLVARFELAGFAVEHRFNSQQRIANRQKGRMANSE